MDITIHQLRCFLAVAHELHFGHAAAEMHLSPSTLSEQIATLERRLDRTLFDRSSRHVQLTTHGEQFHPLAERTVAAMQDVVTWAQTSTAQTRLQVGMVVSNPRFRAIMAEAVRRFPEITWEIRHLEFAEPYAAVERGEVDCAFVVDGGTPKTPEFEAIPLWQEDRVVVLSQDHPLAAYESLKPQDLQGETLLSIQDADTSKRWLAGVTQGHSVPLNVVNVAQNFEEILEMCSAGLGINIAGEFAAGTYNRPGLCFVPMTNVPKITTHLYLKAQTTHPGLQGLAGLVTERANTDPGQ